MIIKKLNNKINKKIKITENKIKILKFIMLLRIKEIIRKKINNINNKNYKINKKSAPIRVKNKNRNNKNKKIMNFIMLLKIIVNKQMKKKLKIFRSKNTNLEIKINIKKDSLTIKKIMQ